MQQMNVDQKTVISYLLGALSHAFASAPGPDAGAGAKSWDMSAPTFEVKKREIILRC